MIASADRKSAPLPAATGENARPLADGTFQEDTGVRIKRAEGQTLLTLLRLCFVFIACLCVGNTQAYADAFFGFVNNAGDMAQNFLKEEEAPPRVYGEPIVLYYREETADGKGWSLIYQQLYRTGAAGSYGLADAAGRELLPMRYQGVLVLPHAYALQSANVWQFFDRETLAPLSDQVWDEVELDLTEQNFIESNLVKVRKNGLYGAVDLRGSLVIEPAYDEFLLNAYQAEWPLIAVKKDGRYGYIDMIGNVVIDLVYDYTVMDMLTVFADENDAQGTEIPIIYVLRDDDWGAIYKENNRPSSVDWDVDPSAEVLASYEQLV